MKTFRIVLGNTETRSGHRKDCAQIRAEVRVSARSKEEALSLVQKQWKARRNKVDALAVDSGGSLWFNVSDDASWGYSIFFRVDTLTLRDVVEV